MITQKIIARTDSLKLDKIISRYGEDSMRQVVFIIVRPDPESDELIPITIPEDAVGSFRILKPSGNFVIVPMSKSVLASGETAFDVVLPASANTAKGSGYYDIRITSETDKYYFTAQGDFLIDDNIISDEVLEDVSEVNGLIFPDDFLTVEDHVAYIDDDTISTDSTWSSEKIQEEIEQQEVSKTVSGNPIDISDASSAPMVKCITQITGYQRGTGTPSPDNIRPIVAYSTGEIVVSDGDGNAITHTTIFPSTIYRGSEDVVNGSVEADRVKIQSDGTGFLIASNGILYNDSNILTGVSSVVEDLIQTITDKYDFYGIITGTAILVGKEGKFALQIIGNVVRIAICDSRFTTAENFRTYLANNPLEIAYKLATPINSSVTPTNIPISTLSGYTHIESSTGEMELEYITQRYQPLIESIKQL